MTENTIVQFHFLPHVPMDEVAGTLELACMAAQILFGPERVELQTSWHLDVPERTVGIDVGAEVGCSLAQVFLGFVRREFGREAVRVEREGVNSNSKNGRTHVAN